MIKIGISASFFHEDPKRAIFKGMTLQSIEQNVAHWLMQRDVLSFMIHSPDGRTRREDSRITLDAYAQELDGLVLMGGSDICPETYGEKAIRPECRIRGIGESFDRIVAQALPAQERAHAMQIAAQNRVMLMLRMLAEPDPFERAADAEDFEQQGIEFGRERDALAELELDDQARGFLDEVRTSAVGLSRPQREIVQALVGGDDAAARALIDGGRVFELQRKLLDRLVVLTRYQRALALQAQRRTQAQQAHASTVMLMLGGGLFVLWLLLGAVVTRAIARAETVLRDKGQRVEQAAHTDALTGLLNRRGFERERRRWRAASKI